MKTEKFKDWHLYFGCMCAVWFEDETGHNTVLRSGTLSWNHEEDTYWIQYNSLPGDDFEYCDFDWKALLRPMENITEAEYDEFMEAMTNVSRYDMAKSRGLMAAAGTNYLLHRRFDLFGLIESGEAMDSTSGEGAKILLSCKHGN
jgi:hypothetical protein